MQIWLQKKKPYLSKDRYRILKEKIKSAKHPVGIKSL